MDNPYANKKDEDLNAWRLSSTSRNWDRNSGVNEAITAFGKHSDLEEPGDINWDGLNDESSAVDHSGTELKVKHGRRSTNPYSDGDAGIPEVIPAPKQ